MEEGLFPGAAVGVAWRGRGEPVLMTFGRVAYPPWAPAVTPETTYDLASLTKPLATAMLTAAAAVEGRIQLSTPVGRLIPGLPPPVGEVSVAALLAHRSGLPPWLPLYGRFSGSTPEARRREAVALMGELSLEPQPAYSDLGYILLGLALEGLYGMDLPRIFSSRFPWSRLSFHPPASAPGEAAPTEWCPVRGRVVAGEVHDLNAWALGGAAGHAGLFGSLRGLMDHLVALDRAWRRWEGELAEMVGLLLTGGPEASGPLGFRPRGGPESSAGRLFPGDGVGHLGFTGVSFWWSPAEGVVMAVLTNRTFPVAPDNPCRHGHRLLPSHPVRERMARFRAAIHDAAMEVVLEGS